jgi:predicted Fe-Mo cluster-binding NifX family protein
MRIAISASEPTLDAEVDPRFGRCAYFIIVDTDSMEFEAVKNSGAFARGGAGTATAQMVVDKNTEVVVTGNCGPNAFQVLSAAGTKVITGVYGKVRDTVQAYKDGQLQPASQPSVPGHFGMWSGR